MAYIRNNPGASFSIIKQDMGMGNGQLADHLNKLEKASRLKSKKIGRRRCFFPRKFDTSRISSGNGYPIRQKIVKILENSPELTQKELSDILITPKSTIRYHLYSLIEQNKVKITKSRKGNKKEYSLIDNIHLINENSYQNTITDDGKK